MRAGPQTAALIDWSSLTFFFGSCVSYLVIIGDTFNLISNIIGSWIGSSSAFYRASPAPSLTPTYPLP